MDKCCDLRDPKIVAAVVILSVGFIFIVVGASVGFSTKYLLNKDGTTSKRSNELSSGPSVRRLKNAGNCAQQKQSIYSQQKRLAWETTLVTSVSVSCHVYCCEIISYICTCRGPRRF